MDEKQGPVTDAEVLESAARLRERAAELRRYNQDLRNVGRPGNRTMVETAVLLERSASEAEAAVRAKRGDRPANTPGECEREGKQP